MPKKLFYLLLIILIGLLAYYFLANKGPDTRAEDAGMAMAKSFCLLFDENLTFEEVGEITFEIVQDYGFETPAEIDNYLAKIEGTEAADRVAAALNETITETCGDDLEERDFDPAEIVESIL